MIDATSVPCVYLPSLVGARAALLALGTGALVQQAQAARAEDAVDGAVASVTEVVKVRLGDAYMLSWGTTPGVDRVCQQAAELQSAITLNTVQALTWGLSMASCCNDELETHRCLKRYSPTSCVRPLTIMFEIC